MFCKSCGKEIKDGVKFCKWCGTRTEASIESGGASEEAAAPENDGRKESAEPASGLSNPAPASEAAANVRSVQVEDAAARSASEEAAAPAEKSSVPAAVSFAHSASDMLTLEEELETDSYDKVKEREDAYYRTTELDWMWSKVPKVLECAGYGDYRNKLVAIKQALEAASQNQGGAENPKADEKAGAEKRAALENDKAQAVSEAVPRSLDFAPSFESSANVHSAQDAESAARPASEARKMRLLRPRRKNLPLLPPFRSRTPHPTCSLWRRSL